jgi:hypothetical protein
MKALRGFGSSSSRIASKACGAHWARHSHRAYEAAIPAHRSVAALIRASVPTAMAFSEASLPAPRP